jgi:hypothetical protein
MARLPDEKHLVQMINNQIVVFNEGTGEELVRYDASDLDAVAQAQKAIHDHPDLDDESKCFAHFWSGYFYAHGS